MVALDFQPPRADLNVRAAQHAPQLVRERILVAGVSPDDSNDARARIVEIGVNWEAASARARELQATTLAW